MEEQACPSLSDIAGAVDRLDDATADWVTMIAGHFYVRDGFKHWDGSRGTLRMSPRQLKAALAFAILQERERCARLADELTINGFRAAGWEIAAAIRKPSPPPQDSHNGCG
jgi:hypothetical protein